MFFVLWTCLWREILTNLKDNSSNHHEEKPSDIDKLYFRSRSGFDFKFESDFERSDIGTSRVFEKSQVKPKQKISIKQLQTMLQTKWICSFHFMKQNFKSMGRMNDFLNGLIKRYTTKTKTCILVTGQIWRFNDKGVSVCNLSAFMKFVRKNYHYFKFHESQEKHNTGFINWDTFTIAAMYNLCFSNNLIIKSK